MEIEMSAALLVSKLLDQIILILVRENEGNWVRAFRVMRNDVGNALAGRCSEISAIRSVSDTYRSIYRGAGSFSDFVIWRKDFDEQKKLNSELNAALDELWVVLEASASEDTSEDD